MENSQFSFGSVSSDGSPLDPSSPSLGDFSIIDLFSSIFSSNHGFLIIFLLSFCIFYFQIFKSKKTSASLLTSLSSLSSSSTSFSSSTSSLLDERNQLLLSSLLQQIPIQQKAEEEKLSIQESQENKLNKLTSNDQKITKNDEPSFPLRCYPFDGPSPRTGAAMCYDSETGILAITGGMYENKLCLDFHIYVSPLDKWIEVTQDTGEGSLYANLLCFDGRICAFGGLKSKKEFHQTIRGFDFEKNKWEDLICISENEPPPRINATLTAVGPNHWVLFGGRGQEGVLFDDMWYLEINEESEVIWEKIDIVDNVSFLSEQRNSKRKHANPRKQMTQTFTPLPREGHAMVAMDDRLVLIGGHTDSKSHIIPNGCVEVFNLETNQWSQIPTNGPGPEVSCMIGGAAHRVGETMQILVIGGSPGGAIPGVPISESLCSDVFCPVYILDISSTPYQWKTLRIAWKGPDMTMPPESRCFFSSCFDSESMCFYLHGGMNLHGMEQTGICLLDCHELLPKNDSKGGVESPMTSGQNEANEDSGEESTDHRDEQIQYADSHFYQEFLELIKPKEESSITNQPKEIMSIAPLPM